MSPGSTAIWDSRPLSQCSWVSIGPVSGSQKRCHTASAMGRLAGASSYARARDSGAPPVHGPARRSAASRVTWRSVSTGIVPTATTARPTASGSLSVSASNGQNSPRAASSSRSRSATPTGAARRSSTTGTISTMMTETDALRPRAGPTAARVSLHTLPLFGRPAPVRLGLGNAFIGFGRNGQGGQLSEPEPQAVVADRRPDRLVGPLYRPQGGRRHRDGGLARTRRAPASRRGWPNQEQIQ